MMHRIRVVLVCFVCVGVVTALAVTSPPQQVPEGAVVVVREGMAVSDIAHALEDAGVVYSKILVQTLIIARGGEHGARAGAYFFDRPEGSWTIAGRIITGDLGVDVVTVRIPEGSTRADMVAIMEDILPVFDGHQFLAMTEHEEGYLFPDTYFFFANVDAGAVRDTLRQTFDVRTRSLAPAIAASGKTLHDIVTMASLVEREAHVTEDQHLIAGVLWNRLRREMLLQVDAPFVYILGKGSSELTRDDLEIDSPYNTYRYAGLPPTPIASPGLGALEAAVFPTESDYLFYLSDAEGVTYYARDFEEHKQNRALYLD